MFTIIFTHRRRFLAYLSKSSELSGEDRFGCILSDALNFIGEREKFWRQHDPSAAHDKS